jgi:hypothetical protein
VPPLAETLVYLGAKGQSASRTLTRRCNLHLGDTVGVRIDADAAHLFDAKAALAQARPLVNP